MIKLKKGFLLVESNQEAFNNDRSWTVINSGSLEYKKGDKVLVVESPRSIDPPSVYLTTEDNIYGVIK